MNGSAPIHFEVQIPYSQGVLGGELLTPPFPGQHPGVVLLHGSGAADRHAPYLVPIRDYLVHHGIAVMLFDKPGSGSSTGDWRHQTFYDRLEQARAVITFLQQRADIKASQVGLYGLSQGAWITLLAAASYPDIPFIIPVSGPGMRPVDQDIYYIEHVMRADGFSDIQIQKASQYVQEILNAAYENRPYAEVADQFIHPIDREPWYSYYPIPDADMWEYFRRNASLQYDPRQWLTEIKCSVLAIFGASDLLLPVDRSVQAYQEFLTKAGNEDVTIKVFPNAGHLLTHPSTGELAPGYLELITDWLLQRVETEKPDESKSVSN